MKLLFYFLCICGSAMCIPPVVEILQGKLSGTSYILPNGRVITAFLGIPYATPPLYERRFKEPEIAKSWTGVYNASTLPSMCLQYDDIQYAVIGEEDCLYLNVYTPKVLEENSNELLDVLVYIHGGGFMFGGGQQLRPDYVMQNSNIVFVSIHYRLGILGFMSTGTTIVPGNNGLKDQAFALKWVQKNIRKFGGNPESVTLAGCSAGGASVHYHYLSPGSEGLFHKGISFSGSVLPPWTLPKNNTEKSIHVAALAGCPTKDVQEMILCLQKRPGRQIVEIAKYFTIWRYEPFTAFGPVVETANSNSFLTEEPYNLLKSGKFKDLPWLVSLCKEEGLFRAAEFVVDETTLQDLEDNWFELAPHLFMYNYSVASEAEKYKISAAIRQFYFDSKPISKETSKELIQVYGDRAFYNDITRAMKLQASMATENVHCFKFSYRGKYSVSNLYSKNFDDLGVSHADDVAFVITHNKWSSLETESDVAMVDFMATMITNFMKTGNPGVTGVSWQPVSKTPTDALRCLEIRSAKEQEMVEYEDKRTINFWSNLLPAEHLPISASRKKDEF